jgi:hypothetical protein
MTKTDSLTWQFLADHHERETYAPTLRDVSEHFGIGGHSAWKRVQKLVALGYVAPQNGKQGIQLLMAPDRGRTLAEALREAGDGISAQVRLGDSIFSVHGYFTAKDILTTGWQVIHA